jgi:metallo-beta-lactamase family protein
MAKITAYGAAQEVTGSKHLLDTGESRILVDCGVFQGHREEARRKNTEFPFPAGSLSSAVNTHGHLDHCGLYPLLVKQGFLGDILATPATRDIAGLVMLDSAKIQAQDARFIEKRNRKDPQPWRKVVPPLYGSRDVECALQQYVTVSYRRPFRLTQDTSVTFYDAGHILGSSLVHFEVQTPGAREPLSVGFTGDLGRKDLPIIRDPEFLPPLDYLVCESTYGDRLHDDMAFAEEELAQVIRETVAKGGRVIIPTFAVERTQEIIYHLHRLTDAGRIPRLPVFVDSPMAVAATAIFKAHPECFDAETHEQFLDEGQSPFAFEKLTYVTDSEESKKINQMLGPCVILASSGMCEGGRILHHLIHGVGDSRNTILVVGFMAENTLGRMLADKRPEVKIFGERYSVKARVKILNAFSAHADYREIGRWVGHLDAARLKGVFLVHGEPAAQAHLAEYLRSLGVRKVEALRAGVPVELA